MISPIRRFGEACRRILLQNYDVFRRRRWLRIVNGPQTGGAVEPVPYLLEQGRNLAARVSSASSDVLPDGAIAALKKRK